MARNTKGKRGEGSQNRDSQSGSENSNKRKGWRGDPEGHARAARGESVRGKSE